MKMRYNGGRLIAGERALSFSKLTWYNGRQKKSIVIIIGKFAIRDCTS